MSQDPPSRKPSKPRLSVHCSSIEDNPQLQSLGSVSGQESTIVQVTPGVDKSKLQWGAAELAEGKVVGGIGCRAVQGHRDSMEDRHTCVVNGENQEADSKDQPPIEVPDPAPPVVAAGDDASPRSSVSFFGVYDGHAGTSAAQFLRENLYSKLIDNLGKQKDNYEEILRCSILEIEAEFREYSSKKSTDAGSTVAVVLIVGCNLYAANVGDSEIVICHSGKPKVLSEVHNMFKNAEEEKRVKECGGVVFHKRLAHPCFNPQIVSLAVTRSIGDNFFKKGPNTQNKASGLIADPFVTSHKITKDDSFFIIGCDGVWDVVSHEEACNFVAAQLKKGLEPQKVSEMLVDEALNKGSQDNITAMVVTLIKQ